MKLLPHHEFWPPRLFELPYYVQLLVLTTSKGMSIRSLMRANYALNHGDIGIGSKYTIQTAFNQAYFPKTQLIVASTTTGFIASKQFLNIIDAFTKKIGYPVMLKSDQGEAGKAAIKIHSRCHAEKIASKLYGDYMLQEFVDYPCEFGIFYVRRNGTQTITGVTEKVLPHVIGDGTSTITKLIERDKRLRNRITPDDSIDYNHILEKGQRKTLSSLGSHTFGSVFLDSSAAITDTLTKRFIDVCSSQPGFNFGRFDVKSSSLEALQKGHFTIIEVNGITSLPTHMFDPKYSFIESYRIFFKHGMHLVASAYEHRHKKMKLLSLVNIFKAIRAHKKYISRAHNVLLNNAR